jgi:hypothetical protein
MTTVSKRFWDKVNKDGPVVRKELKACWLWLDSTKNGRYGNLWVDGRNELTHRVAWFLETGRWPEPFALHKCDNTLCVRFSHLFEGDQQANSEDRKAKGRNNHISKLTPAEVLDIRAQLSLGSRRSELAKKYGVTTPNIRHIEVRASWAHL